MNSPRDVLIVDDNVGDLRWLLDLLRARGYDVIVATNEEAAMSRLLAIYEGKEKYAAAIVDVMFPVLGITEMMDPQIDLDDRFFEDASESGLRVCRKANELGLVLPIACLTARYDAAVATMSEETGIPVYDRAVLDIRNFIDRYLPVLPR